MCKSRYITPHNFPEGVPAIHTGLSWKMDNRNEASTLLKQQENATQCVLWHFTCHSTLAFISLVLSTSTLPEKIFGYIITLDNTYHRVKQIPSMYFQNKETIPKTISNNDGTLASFQGLYEWHISFNYPLICKGRVFCICAWRMTDSDWKTTKLQLLCKKGKFSEMFLKLAITSCSITGESGCVSEGISVTLRTFILTFNKSNNF